MKIDKTLVIEDVEIPVVKGPIGICLSGGADSSLLLYLLMKYHTDHIYIFSLSKNINFRATAIISSKIIEKCIQLTDNINVTHISSYSEIQNDDILFAKPTEFFYENKINIIYTAVTANPPKDISDSFITPEANSQQDLRDPNVKRDIFFVDEVTKKIAAIAPFTNIDKKKISDMYKKLNLMKTLFPNTRSCEAADKLEYYEHCNQCWWCKERLYGFGIL